MESISLDASLNLPTIDPTPARSAGSRGDSSRSFDDLLQRASSKPTPADPRSQQPADRSDSANNSSGSRKDAAPASSSSNDIHNDDARPSEALDKAKQPAGTSEASADQGAAKAEANDQPKTDKDQAAVDPNAAAAAAAAAVQTIVEKVATKPALPTDAQALPGKIEAPQAPAETKSATPTDATALATTDTPDVVAAVQTETVAVARPSELHAAGKEQAKTAAAANASTNNSQPIVVATKPTTTESVAPVSENDERSDKKQHSTNSHATTGDDAKLDAAVVDDAQLKQQADAALAAGNQAAQAVVDAAAEIAATATDATTDDKQSTVASAVTTPQVVDSAGKNSLAPPPGSPAGPSATQKLLDGTSRAPARGGDNASEVDRARFVQRVSKAFQTASERGGPLRLRLSPPELGAVRMEVSIRGGAMTARLEAETPAAQSMLLDNLPALRERLAQHNIKVERFDVDLLGQFSDGSQQSPTDTSDRQAARTQSLGQIRRGGAAKVADAPAPVATSGQAGSGQLNVII